MKGKIIALMAIGMFMLVGLGTVAIAEPDDPVTPNKAPEAPIIIEEKTGLEKQEYSCFFYSIDPEDDDVYYEISWKKVDDKFVCSPDDPLVPWLGPFRSGEEVNIIRNCDETGQYEFKVCAKDEYGNIGLSTTISVKYTKAATNKIESSSGTVHKYGAFVLICTDVEGINDNYHIGGLSNLDFTATSEKFIIATYPIWGTTIIEYEVEIHITIEKFLGVIETNNQGQIEIIGICKNITWEQI